MMLATAPLGFRKATRKFNALSPGECIITKWIEEERCPSPVLIGVAQGKKAPCDVNERFIVSKKKHNYRQFKLVCMQAWAAVFDGTVMVKSTWPN